MIIYFIRHGESLYHEEHLHQTPDVGLSKRGREQAESIGAQLQKLEIEYLITSDLIRAKETADIIATFTATEPEENPLFQEMSRPKELFGHHHLSPRTLTVGARMFFHAKDPHWHYSCEENIHDMRNRLKSAIEYLESLKGNYERIAVVSHALMINLFVAYMCGDKTLTMRDYFKTLKNTMLMKNSSITEVVYVKDTTPYTCDWVLARENDARHLKHT